MPMKVVQVEALRVLHPGPSSHTVTALDLPSLTVDGGEIITVTGRSGSGKTTLLNVLAGITTPTEGTVSVLGTDLHHCSEVDRDRFRLAHVGYVHQQYNLLPGYTALENVLLPATFARSTSRKEQVERAHTLLELVGLKHRLHHRPRGLSGGEQQRVAIARALMLSPQLLLLDEPSANLDKHTTEAVVQLLQDLNALGMTMVIATHDEMLIGSIGTTVRLTAPRRDCDDAVRNRLAQPAG